MSDLAALRPPGWDTSGPTPDHGYILVAWSVVLSVLGVIFVALRITSKLCFHKTLHLEDYLIIVALLMSLILNNFTIACTRYGLGRHIWDITFEESIMFRKLFMPNIWSFAGAHWAVKLSFVAFYKRIYFKHRYTWVINVVYGFIMVVYGIFFVIHCIPCLPLKKYWDDTVDGFCFNAKLDYEILGIFNFIFDFIILLLPIPIVRQAKVKTERKLTLCVVFGLGLFCCITSLLRIVTSLQHFDGGPLDLSWNVVSLMVWSMVEISVGIVVNCMLQLNRLLSWVYQRFKPAETISATDASTDFAKNTFHSTGKRFKNSRGNLTRDIESAMKTLATVDYVFETKVTHGQMDKDSRGCTTKITSGVESLGHELETISSEAPSGEERFQDDVYVFRK